jgi:hypothetical protein
MPLWFWEETEQPFLLVCWSNGQIIARLRQVRIGSA